MTLGRLKRELAKLPPDMDNMGLLIQVARNGKEQGELLGYVGMLPTLGPEGCLVFGGESDILFKIASGKMEAPDNFNPSSPFGYVDLDRPKNEP